MSAFNFSAIFLSSSSPRRDVTTIAFSVFAVVLYPKLFSCSSKKNCAVSFVIDSCLSSFGLGDAPSVVVTSPNVSLSATEIAAVSYTHLTLPTTPYV